MGLSAGALLLAGWLSAGWLALLVLGAFLLAGFLLGCLLCCCCCGCVCFVVGVDVGVGVGALVKKTFSKLILGQDDAKMSPRAQVHPIKILHFSSFFLATKKKTRKMQDNSWAHLGSRAHLGLILASSWPHLGLLLGSSWAPLGGFEMAGDQKEAALLYINQGLVKEASGYKHEAFAAFRKADSWPHLGLILASSWPNISLLKAVLYQGTKASRQQGTKAPRHQGIKAPRHQSTKARYHTQSVRRQAAPQPQPTASPEPTQSRKCHACHAK